MFAQTLFTRAVDPVIPMIASDLAIDVKTAALLSTAFTLPYALIQPALGVIGDFLGKTRLMIIGGAIAGGGLTLIALHLPWQAQIGVYGAFGLGFYLLHSCIQVHVTDLSQTARGAAASLHSSSFYLGQAIGPVIYGLGFAHGGAEPTILFGAVVVLTVGIVCSRLLRRRV